jgi:hypothetical protein
MQNLGAAWRNLATHAVIRGLGFCGLFSKDRPITRPLTTRWKTPWTFFNPDPHGTNPLDCDPIDTRRLTRPRQRFQTLRSKIRGSRSWYQMKGLARRNTHVKYESQSKVII